MSSSLSVEDKIRRIIYKNNVVHRYYSGDLNRYQIDISELRDAVINSSIENDLKEVFTVLDEANSDPYFPRRSLIFIFLGKLMHYEKLTPSLKSDLAVKVLSLCNSDEDFFTFIKYYTEKREKKCKFPSSVEKLVKRYYNNKNSEQLARSFAKFNSLYKWTHKDLIKLAHIKPDSPLKNKVITYIIRKESNITATEEEQEILNIIKKTYQLRSTKDSLDAVSLVAELKLTINQVPPVMRTSKKIWETVIENMTIQEILPWLERLYKYSLLKPGTVLSNYLIALFTNSEKIEASKIHPMEVFIYMKRLEKGGKPLDGYLIRYLEKEKKLSDQEIKKRRNKNVAKCDQILNALLTCFNLACNNMTPTNKRYLVTIEVTDLVKAACCIGTKTLSFLEAAVAYTWILLKVEKEVTVGILKDDKIVIMDVEKETSFNDLLAKVKSNKGIYSSLDAPLIWATSEEKIFDVFVTFLNNGFAAPYERFQDGPVNLEYLKTYRNLIDMPDAKLIMFYLNGPSSFAKAYNKQELVNVLDISGFDIFACKTAESFSRGQFC